MKSPTTSCKFSFSSLLTMVDIFTTLKTKHSVEDVSDQLWQQFKGAKEEIDQLYQTIFKIIVPTFFVQIDSFGITGLQAVRFETLEALSLGNLLERYFFGLSRNEIIERIEKGNINVYINGAAQSAALFTRRLKRTDQIMIKIKPDTASL